jgi:hypothetical protein
MVHLEALLHDATLGTGVGHISKDLGTELFPLAGVVRPAMVRMLGAVAAHHEL